MGKKFKIQSWEDVLNNTTNRVSRQDYIEDPEERETFFLSSGNYCLDLLLSNGRGYPAGVPIEFFGEEHTGKTTDWILLGKQVQSQGGNVILWEAEAGFEESLARLHGLILKKPRFTKYRPRTMEAFCDMWEEACEAAAKLDIPTLLVVDSVAGLCPDKLSRKARPMSGKKERRVGEEAKTFSWFFKRGFVHEIAGSKVFAIFVNQTRSTIGQSNPFSSGPKYTTPAGKTLRFYAKIRLEFSEHSVRKNKHGNDVGAVKTLYTAKNKIVGKGRTIEIPIFYNSPWDDCRGILYYCLANGLFKPHASTGKYYLESIGQEKFCEKLTKGSVNWLQRMHKDPKFLQGMKRTVKAHYLQQWEEDDEWTK